MNRNRADHKIASFPRRKQGSYGLLKLMAMAGLLILGFLLTLIVVQMFQYRRLYRELAAAELRVEQRESRNEEVAEEIARLSEPGQGYIEMLARKLLGLVRPGEIVFQLED